MHATIRVGLMWAMGLLLVAYVVGLMLPAHDAGVGAYRGLGLLTMLLPAAVCWLAVSHAGFRRREILLAAAALTSYAAGDSYYYLMVGTHQALAFPSLADVGYLAFYPLMLAALTVTLRRNVRGRASSVWLDSALGALGAASLVAVMINPVLSSSRAGQSLLASAVAVAYPLLDLLLVAAVIGIAALRNTRLSRRLVLLAGGVAVFTGADTIYATQQARGTYMVGRPLDAGWSIGLALIALWVDGIARRERPSPATRATRTSSTTTLAVSGLATAAGLGVLIAGTQVHMSNLAVSLAGLALVAGAVRTHLAFRRLTWLPDLRRQASTDHLTGLPNRRALYAEGRARLTDPQGQRRALLVLDLDKFKEVNDTLGHHIGDKLLARVGARLRGHLRTDDLLARLGGDEFAVLLADAGYDEATDVAVKLRAALAEPFIMDSLTLHTGVSLGIALFPDDGPDLNSLMRKADIAMYKAKASGVGHHFYNGSDEANEAARAQTVQELRTALAGDQLVLHYQPKIDLRSGDVRSVEALVRWNHPTSGLLYPAAFLSLVEESGMMPALTRAVLALALDQATAWAAQGRQLTVAVNLSASSLVDANLPEQVSAMLSDRGVPPSALQLEITEEFLMADRDRAGAILTRLRHAGVQISIDDFGTGYSSLSYLRDLPVDELKLDRSFIFPMAENVRAAALIASTIGLAHILGLRIVAEGVETPGSYAELKRLGCDEAQGYLMSRPVPAVDLDRWLSTR